MVRWLREKGQVDAGEWFEKNLTGQGEENWMLAHGNVGSSANNMGQEVYYKWLKAATTGKKSVSLPFFLGAMCEYTADRAAEEISKAMNVRGEETEWERLYTFQSAPVIAMKVWGQVQEMGVRYRRWRLSLSRGYVSWGQMTQRSLCCNRTLLLRRASRC